MITNVVMTREMGSYKVLQRTKDGMFNATALLREWNELNLSQKQMVHYTENKSCEDYIKVIMKREGKERNSVLIKTRGKNGGTWMHPMLFLDFAMWLNPEFKYDVIKFVQDKMIEYRNEAGDAYKTLSSAVSSLNGSEDMRHRMGFVAKAMNYLTFGEHHCEIRNDIATEDQQKKLFERERYVAKLINDGFVTSTKELKEYLRKCWIKERCPI